jgi:hypothetical protein
VRLLRFAGILLLAVVACGPSFQAVYECDVHFEHCYALDDRPVPQDAKKECWRAWLRGYTYGQPRDRVEYAKTRVGLLEMGPAPVSEELHAELAPKGTAEAPAPTNAFAPPPHIAAPDAGPLVVVEAGARAPAADCSDECSKHWNACHEACDAATTALVPRQRGQRADSCDECDRKYRACVPDCFRVHTP